MMTLERGLTPESYALELFKDSISDVLCTVGLAPSAAAAINMSCRFLVGFRQGGVALLFCSCCRSDPFHEFRQESLESFFSPCTSSAQTKSFPFFVCLGRYRNCSRLQPIAWVNTIFHLDQMFSPFLCVSLLLFASSPQVQV